MTFFRMGLLKPILLALLITLVLTWGGFSNAEVKDSCIECHSNSDLLATNKKLRDYFEAWQLSIHKQEGISCSDCHGGDPRATTKEEAHKGDLEESKNHRVTHFKNIPDACGQCHDNVYEKFRQSLHYEQLVKRNQELRGPNCITCHGSINVAVFNVNKIGRACRRCHNKTTQNHPSISKEVRLLLNQFLSINRYYRYISIRGAANKTRDFLKNVDARAHALSVDWHALDIPQMKERTDALLKSVKEKRSEIR